VDALELLKSVADEFDSVGYADLLQLASVTGIQVGGIITGKGMQSSSAGSGFGRTARST